MFDKQELESLTLKKNLTGNEAKLAVLKYILKNTLENENEKEKEKKEVVQEVKKELTFLQKVAKIQQELKAPKNQKNKFGNYNYRNCEDIFEAVKPLLGDLVLTVSDEIVVIQDRFYIKATAKITDGVSELTNCAYAREALFKKGMDESQITGATSSYSRKYSLNGLFLIDDTKDADSDEKDDKQEFKKQPIQVQKQIPIEQKDKQKQILALIEWLDPLVDKTKIESIKDFVIKQTQLELKAENFNEIIDRLEILKKERMG